MAIAGDPFQTPELDERRRRQRRHLRTLDRSIVDQLTFDELPSVLPETDTGWLEVELRRVADVEMVHLAELFRRYEEGRGKRMVADFIRRNLSNGSGMALESLADDLTAEAARGWLDGIGARERTALHRYLQLVLWADAVALATS